MNNIFTCSCNAQTSEFQCTLYFGWSVRKMFTWTEISEWKGWRRKENRIHIRKMPYENGVCVLFVVVCASRAQTVNINCDRDLGFRFLINNNSNGGRIKQPRAHTPWIYLSVFSRLFFIDDDDYTFSRILFFGRCARLCVLHSQPMRAANVFGCFRFSRKRIHVCIWLAWKYVGIVGQF